MPPPIEKWPARKPRYSGTQDIPEEVTPSFSDTLRNDLKKLYVECHGGRPPEPAGWDSQDADQFAEEVLQAGDWARDEIDGLQCRSIKKQIRAELEDLTRTVAELELKLRKVSPALDALILRVEQELSAQVGAVPTPLDQADYLKSLCQVLRRAAPEVEDSDAASLQSSDKRAVGLEMTIRVGQAFRGHGIAFTATYDPEMHTESPAVQLIERVGREAGLRASARTWRNRIAAANKDAKKSSP